jgi:DNA-binding PadR family transcriptional regulator
MDKIPEEGVAAADERAEPRMTLPRQLVLGALLNADQSYGLEISKQVSLPTGTIYPILATFERAGWVTGDWEELDPVAAGRRPRRYYSLTTLGRLRAQAKLGETARLITPQWPQWRPAPGPAGAVG